MSPLTESRIAMKLAAATGALLVMIIIAGCAGELARDATKAAAKGTRSSATAARSTFIHAADRACQRLSVDYRAWVPSIKHNPVGELPPEQLPTATLGLAVAERYLNEISALEPPLDGKSLHQALLTDAYATYLLVFRVATAATIPDHARFLAAKAELDEHVSNATPRHQELQQYGFTTCGQPSPGAHSNP